MKEGKILKDQELENVSGGFKFMETEKDIKKPEGEGLFDEFSEILSNVFNPDKSEDEDLQRKL